MTTILQATFLRAFFKKILISIQIPPLFAPGNPIGDKSVSVQIMIWRQPGDKSLAEPINDGLQLVLLPRAPVSRVNVLMQQRSLREVVISRPENVLSAVRVSW